MNPPATAHIHIWWHWISGNITQYGIKKDLESMKEQGITQATIFNVGGFVSCRLGIPNVKFNSKKWYEMFHYALKEAKRQGITIGVQDCDGWSTSGGPWITPEMSMKTYTWSKTYFDGGREIEMQLAQPPETDNFYRDYAVIAFPAKENANSFLKAEPQIDLNNIDTGTLFFDGNPKSKLKIKQGDVINIVFRKNFTTDKIVLLANLPFSWDDMSKINSQFILSSSSDGKFFSKIADVEFVGLNKSITVNFPKTTAKYFKLECTKCYDDYPLAELELLSDDERPTYDPEISHLLEKTVSVSALSENDFDNTLPISYNGIDENSVINLTSYVSSKGVLKWNAPKGYWCVIRFGYTTTGMMNEPATPEGQGLECDKMDTLALNIHFKSYIDKLIDAAGSYKGKTFKFIQIDSWEAQFQNWTKNFPYDFLKLRGYNLIKWIPVLCGETVDNTKMSEAFLYDYRKTIADLISKNYYNHFSQLCHKDKLALHAEVIYGGGSMYPPLDILKSNKYIDIPMTEFWADPSKNQIPEYVPNDRPIPFFPAYSALADDKPIIASEAYTGYANYSATPSYLKAFGDMGYCSGVNQIILHSYVLQPFDKKPGVTLGKFGTCFNRNNPWWEYSRDWLTYQARIQYILQKGEPIVDVIFYIGDNLPQNFDKSIIWNLPSGFRANPCNFDMLQKAKVENGKISFGRKQKFSILTLPNRKEMEFTTLKRIGELVSEGAIVYGPKPTEMLSLLGIKNNTKEFNQLADSIWGESASGENNYGKGKVFYGQPIDTVLKKLNLLPDFSSYPFNPKELMFIHKLYNNTDVYFVFNQQNKLLNRELLFRVTNKIPEIWNPEDGTVVKPEIYSNEKDQIRIPVTFQPRESLIFIFEKGKSDHYLKAVQFQGKQIFPNINAETNTIAIPQARYNNGKYSFSTSVSGDYQFITGDNKIIKSSLVQPEQLKIVNYQAKLKFLPISKDSIKTIEISNLKSLTDFNDSAIKYFAGKVKYTIKFKLPENFNYKTGTIKLNLGNINATAKVRLNNSLLGYIWMPNSYLNVSGLLRRDNTLNITVATACRNRFIGDLREFGKVKSVFTTSPIETILNKEMPLIPSGIIGPIILTKYN
jgi:hypothetical protein